MKGESRSPSRERARQQAKAVAGGDIEDPGDRGQETGRQRQSAGCRRRRDRARRQAEAAADDDIEDSRHRGQETRRQSQSAGRGGSSPAKLILRPATAAGPNDDFGPKVVGHARTASWTKRGRRASPAQNDIRHESALEAKRT